MEENAPQAESRQSLPSWIKEEGSQPIRFYSPWLSLVGFLCVLAMLLRQTLGIPLGLMMLAIISVGFVAAFLSLYQVVWITHTGIAWRTLSSTGWVHWNEVNAIKECIRSQFIPDPVFENGVLGLPIELVSLHRVRSIMTARPRRNQLALPATANLPSTLSSQYRVHLVLAASLFIMGYDMKTPPFGLQLFNTMLVGSSILLAGSSLLGLLIGASNRGKSTIAITESGLTTRHGSITTALAFSDIAHAALIHTSGSPSFLRLEAAQTRVIIPYEMLDFDQWKEVIAARLPEGVVIKDG